MTNVPDCPQCQVCVHSTAIWVPSDGHCRWYCQLDQMGESDCRLYQKEEE